MMIVIKTIWQTDELYKCLSEELSFSFKHGEAEIYRTVKRFTRYSEAELQPENKPFCNSVGWLL